MDMMPPLVRQRPTDDGEGSEPMKPPSRRSSQTTSECITPAPPASVAVTASRSMMRPPDLIPETVSLGGLGGKEGLADVGGNYSSDVGSVPGAFQVKGMGSSASCIDDDWSDLQSWTSYTVQATLVPDDDSSSSKEESKMSVPSLEAAESQTVVSQVESCGGHEHIRPGVVRAEPLSAGGKRLKPFKMISKLMFRHGGRSHRDRPQHGSLPETKYHPRLPAKDVENALAIAKPTSTQNSMSTNQLLSPKGKLYGRDKEIEILGECLKRSVIDRDSRQLVLVAGMSGSGKTALAQSISEPCRSLNGMFARGKFDVTRQHEPYSGILSACNEMCQEILSLKAKSKTKRSFDKIVKDILREVGEELPVLARLLPMLDDIVGVQYQRPLETRSLTESGHRLTFAFLRFIRVVSSHFQPFVLHLDDAQVADFASLELLGKLSTDNGNRNIMVIVSYRSSEVDSNHPLTASIENLCCADLTVTNLMVDDLDVSACAELLTDLVGETSYAKIRGLAQVCHSKTGGNVFFLIHFVNMLRERSLLTLDKGEWSWDANEIATKTQSTDNVVNLVKQKMWKLSDEDNTILQIAACLGSPFDVATLRVAWCAYSGAKVKYESDATIDRWIFTSLAEGYIEEHGDSHYQWIHDKIQEAAGALVNARWKSGWHYRIGQILCQNLSEEQLDQQIFPVVNLLNTGVDQCTDSDERVNLSKLNLQAALKAVEFSAFGSARVYTRNGVALLPKNQWTHHFNLAVQLHSTAAEVEGYFGKEEEMSYHCRTVLERRDTSMADKYRVYNVLIDFTASSNRHLQAIGLCLSVLKQSGGITLPKGQANMLIKVRRILSQTKPLPTGRINELRELQDPDRIAQMKILQKLAICCYEIGSPLTTLALDCSVKLTLEHGICESSAVSFALTGATMAGKLSDFNGATIYGQQALIFMEKLNAKSVDSKVRALLHNIILPWTTPVHDQISPLLEGYHSGLKSGDVDSAIECLRARCAVSFVCGRPLHEIEADCRLAANQILEFNRFRGMNYVMVMLQATLNMMGKSQETTLVTGEAMNQDEFLSEALLPEDGPVLAHLHAHRVCLHAFFGEFDVGAALVVAENAPQLPGAAFSMAHEYMKGVCLFAAARNNTTKNNRIYRTHAKKVLKKIEKWVKDGNPNVRHCEMLLKAEKAALDGKTLQAKNYFDTGLGLAERGGFVHHVALANERFGEFLLQHQRDVVSVNRKQGLRRLRDAVKCYESWGAQAKVTQLREKYPDL